MIMLARLKSSNETWHCLKPFRQDMKCYLEFEQYCWALSDNAQTCTKTYAPSSAVQMQAIILQAHRYIAWGN